MRGRRFIAAFDPLQGWYRACVEIRVEMTDAECDLPEMVIPGGPYLRLRLRGDPPEVYDEIARRTRSWSPPPTATTAARALSDIGGSTRSTS